jgi:integrase
MKTQVRPATWESYERNLRVHVVPRIGAVPLRSLTPTHLNRLYAELLESGRAPGNGRRAGKGPGLSPRTVAYIHTIIHRALRDATKDGVVLRNVAAAARPPKQRASGAPEIHTWNADELRAFLDFVSDEQLYPVFMVAATTGMRRGEVLGLPWRDIDLDSARASIRQTVVCVGHKVAFSTPKTPKSKRSVPLPREAVDTLRGLHRQQTTHALDGSDLVFQDDRGDPLDPESVSLVFERRVKSSGLPRIRFHDLRHTFATLALQAGVPLKVVSDILGHENISITADTYSHVIPAMQEDATSRVAALVFGGLS